MTVFRNATILQLHPPVVKERADFAVDNGMFVEPASSSDSETVEMAGAFVMPGLVCSHTHLYSALARGITVDIRRSTNFVSHLQSLWWRLDRAIDRDILASSALVGALDAVSRGTTAIVDHHASPSYIKGSLDTIAAALTEVGVRGILCYEVTDRNGETGMREGVEENTRFCTKLSDSGPEEILRGTIGAHAPFTLGDEALGLLGSTVNDTKTGLHIHTAEDAYDPSQSHHLYQQDIMQRLDAFGCLNEKSLCVHGVHLTDADIRLLNERGAFLVHNPRSNMNNNVGYGRRIHDVKNAALGTDGIGADMFEEGRIAYFKARDAGLDAGPDTTVKLLQNGSRLMERYFEGGFGKIAPGCNADFVVLDYSSPTPLVAENLSGHFVFGMSSRDVKSVYVAGRRIYHEGAFAFDTAKIYAEARNQAARLWERMAALPS